MTWKGCQNRDNKVSACCWGECRLWQGKLSIVCVFYVCCVCHSLFLVDYLWFRRINLNLLFFKLSKEISTVLWEYNSRPLDCFSKAVANITHTATSPKSDITEGNLSDYKQITLKPQKAPYYFFHIVHPKTCKHTSMYKMVGVTL